MLRETPSRRTAHLPVACGAAEAEQIGRDQRSRAGAQNDAVERADIEAVLLGGGTRHANQQSATAGGNVVGSHRQVAEMDAAGAAAEGGLAHHAMGLAGEGDGDGERVGIERAHHPGITGPALAGDPAVMDRHIPQP